MPHQTNIIPRPNHTVSRSDISEAALKVLYRLHNAGYESHLVGGCVRDLLLKRHPKDFDVVTNAHPEDVRRLFDNCRLIGRRFRLAHVLFGKDIIEVATFRGQHSNDDQARINADNGRIVCDNVYGNMDEDVWRRDFTMNALYYNIADFSVTDYVGAIDDIQQGLIRLIGEPEQRYREDPVRMLRAVRFAAKLGFTIEEHSKVPIYQLGGLLRDIPPARLFDEALKLFHNGHAQQSFTELCKYDLFKYLFPSTAPLLDDPRFPCLKALVYAVLANTDSRLAEGKSVTPAFLYAMFLWGPLLDLAGVRSKDELPNVLDMQKAASELLARQAQHTAVPRRFTVVMRDIWTLQTRLQRYRGKRALKLLIHPRFRAAYDLLLLRASAGEPVQESVDWWTDIQDKDPGEQLRIASQSPQKPRRRRSRRKRKTVKRPASPKT